MQNLIFKNEEQNIKFRLLKQRSCWTDCSLMKIYEVGVSLVIIHSLKAATKLGLAHNTYSKHAYRKDRQRGGTLSVSWCITEVQNDYTYMKRAQANNQFIRKSSSFTSNQLMIDFTYYTGRALVKREWNFLRHTGRMQKRYNNVYIYIYIYI